MIIQTDKHYGDMVTNNGDDNNLEYVITYIMVKTIVLEDNYIIYTQCQSKFFL